MIIKKTILTMLIGSIAVTNFANAQEIKSNNNVIVMGNGTEMKGSATNDGKYGISMGWSAENNSKDGIAIGSNSKNKGDPNWRKETSEYKNIIIVPIEKENGLIEYITKRPENKTEKSYGYGVAIGSNSRNNYSGIAVGEKAINDGEYGLAIGRQTVNVGDNSISIGNGSRTKENDKNVVSVGNDKYTYNDYSDSFYLGGRTIEVEANKRKIIHVANGDISESSHETITGSQLFIVNEKVIKNEKNIAELSLLIKDGKNIVKNNNIDEAQDISSAIENNEIVKSIKGELNKNTINIENNTTKISNLNNIKVDKAELEITNQAVAKNKIDITNMQSDIQTQSEKIDMNSVEIAQNKEDIKELKKYTNIGISNVAAMSSYDFGSIEVGNRGVGVGIAHHGNAQAVSIGMGYRPNKDIVIGGKLATNTKDIKNVTVNVGGMYQF